MLSQAMGLPRQRDATDMTLEQAFRLGYASAMADAENDNPRDADFAWQSAQSLSPTRVEAIIACGDWDGED